jgi:hypothetical protein
MSTIASVHEQVFYKSIQYITEHLKVAQNKRKQNKLRPRQQYNKKHIPLKGQVNEQKPDIIIP